MTKTLEQTAKRVIGELWSNGNFDVVDEIYSDEATCHFMGADGPIHGREGLKAYVEEFRTAFPDMSAEFVDLISTDDTISGRYRMTATHKGEWNEIPATDREVTTEGIVFVKFDEHGHVIEEWNGGDQMEMLTQLGVAPQLST